MSENRNVRGGQVEYRAPRFYQSASDFDAVIFDLDGTLLDSMGVWGEIDIEYMGRLGLAVPEGLQMDISGMSFYETAVYFKERFHVTDSIEKIMDDWNQMAFLKYQNEVRCKPGGAEYLHWCHDHGILLGVATSNSRILVSEVLKSNGIEELFGAVVTGSEVLNGKPQPDIYLAVAAQLGVRPERCLVFEDVVPGIQAARAAGMRVIAVEDDASRSQEEEKLSLADVMIRDFYEIGLRD
ncbi:MAG: HAD family phosphatase [Lachnospiraceae bacterium]|nr:HAD family phosphatase [Lachnospiraceae bacterium]